MAIVIVDICISKLSDDTCIYWAIPMGLLIGLISIVMGVMKMANIVPRVGIELTSLAFQASVLPLHHVESLMSPLCMPMPTSLCSSLPQRSMQTTRVFIYKLLYLGPSSLGIWICILSLPVAIGVSYYACIAQIKCYMEVMIGNKYWQAIFGQSLNNPIHTQLNS